MDKYEFLEKSIKYGELNIFQKHKADWLEESNKYAPATKKSHWINLNTKVNFMEIYKNRDLYDFSKEEIVELVKNIQTKSHNTKVVLFSTISRYMEWVYKKGIKIGNNPCDTIVPTELFTVNELAFKEQYIEISDFINFVYDLDCSDVDRAMLTLLRYGVKIDDVGKVKWDDISADGKFLRIQHKNKDLELPIDGIFMMMMDKAKNCHYRDLYKKKSTMKEESKVKIVSYRNSEYIVKPLENVEWDYMDGRTVYNRIQRISASNKNQIISVPDLNSSRKCDFLFKILDENREVNTKDMDKILLKFEGVANASRRNTLRKEFEKISGIKVKEKRNVDNRKRKEKIKLELNENFIDSEDSNYQNDIIEALKNNENDDTSNYEYRYENKKQKSENEDRIKIYVRDSRIGRKALQLAGFKCEFDSKHETFISNANSENYVEAHHIIPIKYYYNDEFEYSIDNEANIVALCPTCHRRLHYGQLEDKKIILKKLYDENVENLKKAGIDITLDRLLEMYIECSRDNKTN